MNRTTRVNVSWKKCVDGGDPNGADTKSQRPNCGKPMLHAADKRVKTYIFVSSFMVKSIKSSGYQSMPSGGRYLMTALLFWANRAETCSISCFNDTLAAWLQFHWSWLFSGELFLNHVQWSPLCTCFQDIETVEHMLFVYPFYDTQCCKFKSYWVKFLKYWPPKLCDIPKPKPLWSCFKNFVMSTKRLVLPRTANDMN